MTITNKYLKQIITHIKLWGRTLLLIKSVVPGWASLWMILLILQGVLPGATIYLTKLTIDAFIATRDNFSLLNHALVLLILTGVTLILAEVFRFAIDWVRTVQTDVLTDHLKNLIHRKAAEVDIEFYESPAYFDLLEHVKGNSISKPLALLESFGAVLQSVITLLTFSTMLISYGWWVPLLLLASALPAFFIYIKSERAMHEWTKETTPDRRWQSYLDMILTANFSAPEIRVFSLNTHFRQRFQELSLRLRSEKMQLVKKQVGGKFFAAILTLLTAGAGVGWMALKVLSNAASLGDLAVFYQIFTRGQALMQSLLSGMNQTFSSGLYLENLFEFLDLKPKMTVPEKPISFPAKLRDGIRFSNVSFTYPGAARAAIKNFNLFIPAGKLVAIVGLNGAGKSTLIKLLCRFYDPNEGKIEIDGVDIRDFDPTDLRKNLSLYFQFPMCFMDSAAQNIRFGDIERIPQPEELQTAAENAGAHNFITKLPSGYETMLGKHFANGCELSGGQWQRLTLARAYYRKAPVLILDEPTSFMDSWSEVEWFDHLRDLLVGRTGLIITHRFTIAMRADVIHVLDASRLIESGTHQELVKADGFYAESWKSQMSAAQRTNGAATAEIPIVNKPGAMIETTTSGIEDYL